MSESSKKIVDQMYALDAYSQWLGIKLILIEEAHCIIEMEVRKEMTNGFGIAHGGISYSFADSAFAFASNSRGRIAVSIETSISHTMAINVGDILRAEAKEDNLSNTLGQYNVKVTNQDNKVVALFKGTVFRKKDNWKL